MVGVSVVIPAMNEEKTIGTCISKVKRVFKEHGIDGEIIISDSSTDKTPEIAKSLGAKVVTPDKKGYGYAYLYAFKEARGDIIVIGDADNTYDFLEMSMLLEPLKNGYDMVMGDRLHGNIQDGAMPWLHRYIGNPILTWFLNTFFKAGVRDSHSGFRAIKREALKKLNLRSHGMEFASEMIMEAARKGLRIKEVPITYLPREGESKLSSFSDGWRHLKFMLLNTPIHLYFIPGFLMYFLGMVGVLAMNFTDINVGEITLGVNSVILFSLTAIVGYQVIFLGVFSSVYGHSRGFFDQNSIVEFVTRHMSLEKGATIGAIVFSVGFLYSLSLVARWMQFGVLELPEVRQSILGLTLLVIGMQTVFYSFFLSLLGET